MIEDYFEAGFKLMDGEAWVYDAESLNPSDDETEDGVLAVLNRDGALFVLVKDGPVREWVNVEKRAGVRRIQ